MALPGTVVTTSSDRARRGLPTDTGVLIVAAPFSSGTLGVVHTLETADDLSNLGTRTGGAIPAWDAIETAFAEGVHTVKAVRIGTGFTTVAAALALVGPEHGPGQVAAPGDTTAHAALQTHAASSVNRHALLDTSAADIIIPPVSGSTTNRTAPASGFVAGLLARSDAVRSPNDWPAGDRGFARWVLGVQASPDAAAAVTLVSTVRGTNADYSSAYLAGWFTDAQRETLNTGGINVVRVSPLGGVQLYGARTPSSSPAFLWAGNSRLRMYLVDRCRKASEQFVFRQIDGKGYLIAEFAAVLSTVLDEEYSRGAIYGDTPDEAYDVDTSVNTPTTIAAGQLKAVVTYKPSPTAEVVSVELSQATLDATI